MEANRMKRRRSTFFEDRPTMKRVIVLFIVLHTYMITCAFVFKHFETTHVEGNMTNLQTLHIEISKYINLSTKQYMNLTQKILVAAQLDRKAAFQNAWSEFTTSFWFVTTLFTTVGTGHVVPFTFEGRLFSILSALVGIPLYALFLKHTGDCISSFNKCMLRHFEYFIKRKRSIRKRNIKCFIFALMETIGVILIGAAAADPFGWTYFEGIYFCFISLSTVGFGDLVPDTSRPETKIYGIIYIFYNVIGLSMVSCLISSMVKAMDDVDSMKRALFATSVSIKRRIFQGTMNVSQVETKRRFSHKGTFKATIKRNLYSSEENGAATRDGGLKELTQQESNEGS